jgi:hypothetical protein
MIAGRDGRRLSGMRRPAVGQTEAGGRDHGGGEGDGAAQHRQQYAAADHERAEYYTPGGQQREATPPARYFLEHRTAPHV